MDSSTLAQVMGGGADYQRLVGPMNAAMIAADITNPQRAAMWCAQIGHESAGLRYMEEIADGSAYEGRADLGNTQSGDGRRYKGRGPIQLTGRNNYRAFTRWARDRGLSSIDFEAEPHRLSEPEWGFLAATYYWVAARPQINSLADAGDLIAVTRAINGGLNGLSDRQQRYDRALSMGNRIMPGETRKEKTINIELKYLRDQVVQDTGYNCGPASTQTVVHAATGAKSFILESEFASRLGTTTNGTNWIGSFPDVLNRYLPGGKYAFRDMPRDPATPAQKEQMWNDIVASLSAGYGVIANIVAPPNNYPKAVYPSTESPAYRGGTVYHYIAIMGVSDEGQRKVWVADSGFSPYGYWLGFDQLATLVPPKGYAYSTAESTNSGGFLMALNDNEQRELLDLLRDIKEKNDRVHHELTHEFQSLVVNKDGTRSTWRGTALGILLQGDRKIDDIHKNMVPSLKKDLKSIINGLTNKKESK